MKNKGKTFLIYLLTVLLFSCSSDDEPFVPEQPDPIQENPEEEQEEFTPIGTVQFIKEDKVDDNYILVNDAGANRVYMMNKNAKLVYEWTFTNNIGNDVYLLPTGQLLASLESDEPKMPWGGKGGRIQLIQPDGALDWDFILSSEDRETHHDVELLPNGNVLAMVWEKIPSSLAINEGFITEETDIYPESIIEINPTTDEIVWEWKSMDHVIQENDASKNNYGSISENPQLIDINYTVMDTSLPPVDGDIMHANAIAYDDVNDVILLSINSYSEIWFIDHSTTTEEAAGHTGGNYGKGGDLIYRFGNPNTYQNTEGNRLFHNNHFPNLLKGENQGNMLIFSNGNDIEQSTVYELKLPDNYNLAPFADNEPEIVWNFTDTELYSGKVSGAVLLENGNILITEGDFGFWEVTREKEVVWKFTAPGFYWRGYHYLKNGPEVLNLGL